MPEHRRSRATMRAALAVVAMCAASTSASYIPARSLFLLERQNTCAIQGQSICPGAGVPDGFCCGASDACMMLAGRTTALCCPLGQTCGTIRPISCDLKLQDPKAHPESVVKTTVFDVDLETCDNGCCPFGYTCSNKLCVINPDKSTPPGRPSQSSSPSGRPTSSGAAGGTTTAPSTLRRPSTTAAAPSASTTGAIDGAPAATASPSATAVPGSAENEGGGTAAPATDSATKTPSIIGGVVGALMFLVVVAVAIFFCYRRKKKNAGAGAAAGSPRGDGASSIMAYGNAISHPLPMATSGAMRSDFNRKRPVSSSHSYGGASDHVPLAQAGAAVGQNYYQHPSTPPTRNLTGRTAVAPQISPLRGMRPSDGGKSGGGAGGAGAVPAALRPGGYGGFSPPQRQPSTESIDVYVDGGRRQGRAGGGGGGDRRCSTDTTFTTLIRQADLPDPRYGATFVPPAAFSTPGRRA